MTTTIIIISLIVLVVIACVSGVRVSQFEAETRALRSRNVWLETDIAQLIKDVNALATVVAKTADRCTRLEDEDAPRRPACPQTYIMTTYPKRADEV